VYGIGEENTQFYLHRPASDSPLLLSMNKSLTGSLRFR